MMRTPKNLPAREEHTTGREIRELAEAERQVMIAAMALSDFLNAPGDSLAGKWFLLMDLDYACVALKTARRRVDESAAAADRAYRSYSAVTR